MILEADEITLVLGHCKDFDSYQNDTKSHLNILSRGMTSYGLCFNTTILISTPRIQYGVCWGKEIETKGRKREAGQETI